MEDKFNLSKKFSNELGLPMRSNLIDRKEGRIAFITNVGERGCNCDGVSSVRFAASFVSAAR
jgi:hypothetical protein